MSADSGKKKKKTLLVFSQVYLPDPASVGQHIADVAAEMARRGYRVIVYASARGYENPKIKYPKREVLNGVEVRRFGLASFGKKSLLTRAIGMASFMTQAFFRAMFTPKVAGIFFSTSPPMVGVIPALAKKARGVPIAYWAMDLNPDQLVVMGKKSDKSLMIRMAEKVNRFILRKSNLIVALDRFMAERLLKRGDYKKKMLVMPPWPHEDHIENIDPANNPFRKEHGLDGKFVVMYSGNHSPANPLATLLKAAVALKDDDRIRFLFVGGGLGKKEVEATIAEHKLTNAISLPYQPLEVLGKSLSAADVHVVSLGEKMVGIIHPCKIYGAMTVARPILYFGPSPSHVSDIIETSQTGWQIAHGDVDGAVKTIREVAAMDPAVLKEKGERAQRIVRETMAQQVLCGKFCDALERVLEGKGVAAEQPGPGLTPAVREG